PGSGSLTEVSGEGAKTFNALIPATCNFVCSLGMTAAIGEGRKFLNPGNTPTASKYRREQKKYETNPKHTIGRTEVSARRLLLPRADAQPLKRAVCQEIQLVARHKPGLFRR